MEVNLVNVRKLQIVFDDAWKRIRGGNRPVCVECDPERRSEDGEFWTLYMNQLDCTLVDEEDLLENFDDMVNFGRLVKESVCLKDPCGAGGFILVPMEFATRAVVLGGLA